MREPIDKLHEVKAEKLKREWFELRKNYSELCSELAVPVLQIKDENKRYKILEYTRKVRANIVGIGIHLGERI